MRFQSRWLRGAMVFGIVLSLAAAWCIHRLLGLPPNATIGRDTTWLEGPLDADGFVDYRAAWRRDHAAGVTAENNAAPLVFAALGLDPGCFTEQERAALPAVPNPFVPSGQWQYEHPDSFPNRDVIDIDGISTAFEEADLDGVCEVGMEEWLAHVDASLDLLCEAEARPRLYVPDADDSHKYEALVDLDGLLESAGRALVQRALHLAWKGEQERACAGFEAALRLASLERSLDVGPFTRVAYATELAVWKLARRLDDVGGGASASELARLQKVDTTTVEERLHRFLTVARLEVLRDFQASLRAGGPPARSSEGLLARFRRLTMRRFDPDPGCRRVNEGFDAFDATLFSKSSWNERVAAIREDGRRRERDLFRRLASDALFPTLGSSLERIADAMLLAALHDVEQITLDAVRCAAEADLALAELGAHAYTHATHAIPSTSDDLTPLVFERPFRDRLLGSTVTFAREEGGRLVARGPLADLQRELDAVALGLPEVEETGDGESK